MGGVTPSQEKAKQNFAELVEETIPQVKRGRKAVLSEEMHSLLVNIPVRHYEKLREEAFLNKTTIAEIIRSMLEERY
ncbi:MAG: hypothetical protein Q4D63_02070 [Neisseria animaloris]|nr:hypothetical protein [Neisseria animaloris]